ncbi:MAG: ATP-binding cassette domain-containing protein [Microbacterium sp.]|nr:MAG: ATP-binding cassette domain-containing protein [Microbacterium sp.]
MRLTVYGLSYRYGTGSLLFDDLDFEVGMGEMLALTGPSGCGKSTLLDLVGGLRVPTGGVITFAGGPPGEDPRRRVAWIAQSTPVLGGRTATDNVALALVAQGHSVRSAAHRAASALRAVGLESRTGALIGELSGGEVQRVSVARCLAMAANIILADEPTAQLDADNTAMVIEALAGAAAAGKIVLIATHDRWVAAQCHKELHLRTLAPRE